MSFFRRIKDAIAGGRNRDPRYTLHGHNEVFVKVRLQDLEELTRNFLNLDSVVRQEHHMISEAHQVLTLFGATVKERDDLINCVLMELTINGYIVEDIEHDQDATRTYVTIRKNDK